MLIKLERIVSVERLPQLKRKSNEGVVNYLKRMTIYMNRELAGLDGKYEETLR